MPAIKVYSTVSLVLFVLMCCLGCTSVNKDVFIKDERLKKKVTIAVFPFKDAPGYPGSGIAVSDTLTGEMIKIKNWDIVEREQIDRIIKEQAMDAAGLSDADFNRLGKLIKTDYVVIGSVSEFSYYRGINNAFIPKTILVVNARVIDVEKGRVAGAMKYQLESGKYAWCGCCLLGYYYIPVALLTEENKYGKVGAMAEDIVNDIEEDLSK